MITVKGLDWFYIILTFLVLIRILYWFVQKLKLGSVVLDNKVIKPSGSFFISIALLAIWIFVSLFISREMLWQSIFFTTLLILVVLQNIKPTITQKGIFAFGNLYKWNRVDHFNFGNDLVTFYLRKRFLGGSCIQISLNKPPKGFENIFKQYVP